MIPRKRWAYVIPVAVVLYLPAYLDRTNVAVILPSIGGGFPSSAGAKGLASGIFFVGYLVLQLPAAVLAAKWSARKTVLSLLASWFPQAERARANALWMTCLPISAILMAPLSGFVLDHMSWRWVFVLPGLPPLVWAVVWWFAVAGRPARARWISPVEREYPETTLQAEEDAKPAFAKQGHRQAPANREVLLLAGVYFFVALAGLLPGNLGGFAGPYPVGWLTDVTGTATTGFAVLAALLAVAAGLAFSGLKPATVEGSAHVPAATRHP